MILFGRKKKQEPAFQYDPQTQYAVIRSSICTGEKVAGQEAIYWHDQKVYECFFHVGVTKG